MAAAPILIGLLYGASPVDLIPDLLPLVGILDDGVVLLLTALLAAKRWQDRRAEAKRLPVRH